MHFIADYNCFIILFFQPNSLNSFTFRSTLKNSIKTFQKKGKTKEKGELKRKDAEEEEGKINQTTDSSAFLCS